MYTSFIIIAAIIIIFMAGRINLAIKFKSEVKMLFSGSENISLRNFNYEELNSLPPPVQRYFKLVLNEGQPYISYVRITHDGQFKAGFDKCWMDIKGEQYATTATPGFIWKGTTAMFVARDMYIQLKGKLKVSILSLFTVVNAEGSAYDQGELLRWLGESILYPTNLLPGNRLQWQAIDALHAKLIFNYNGLSLFYLVSFNDLGEITEMETQRYMDEKNLEKWIIKMGNYKRLNGILIPTFFEVLWRLGKGDFSYAKFNIRKVEYDQPEKF